MDATEYKEKEKKHFVSHFFNAHSFLRKKITLMAAALDLDTQATKKEQEKQDKQAYIRHQTCLLEQFVNDMCLLYEQERYGFPPFFTVRDFHKHKIISIKDVEALDEDDLKEMEFKTGDRKWFMRERHGVLKKLRPKLKEIEFPVQPLCSVSPQGVSPEGCSG